MMGLPKGLEGVCFEMAVVAVMWDTTQVLLIGVEGREVARDEFQGSGKHRPVADFGGVLAAEGDDGESC